MLRRLISLVAASLIVLSGCGSPDEPSDVRRQGLPTATATQHLESASRPKDLGCDGSRRQVAIYDTAGHRRFGQMLAVWSRTHGRPYVDRRAGVIWFLREDGSAHSALSWARSDQQRAGRRWFVDSVESCPDAGQWKDVAASSTPVELTIGSCWIEPIRFGDQIWDFTEEEVGVRQSRPLTLHGEVSAAGDVATYTDESGRRITLVPQGDPWGFPRDVCN